MDMLPHGRVCLAMTETSQAVFVAAEQDTTFCNARFELSLGFSYGSLIDSLLAWTRHPTIGRFDNVGATRSE